MHRLVPNNSNVPDNKGLHQKGNAERKEDTSRRFGV